MLTGSNGAGKTNILEALSLFSPGRGLRNAKSEDILNKQTMSPAKEWAVSAQIDTAYGTVRIGTASTAQDKRRRISVQGALLKSQTALGEYLSVLWLTPQMDGLFMGGASERRRFFDRMIYAFDPAHMGRLTRYENAMRQRSRILTEDGQNAEASWLKALESDMAETAVAITVSRLDFVKRLNAMVRRFAESGALKNFPLGQYSLSGFLAEGMNDNKRSALDVEDELKERLSQSRKDDARRGGATDGAHKSDFVSIYMDKQMPADQCSTGEQKALLTGLMLSFAMMRKSETGQAPVLLLDEIAAHFDESRRAELFDLLEESGAQVFMTGTDRQLFDALTGRALFLTVDKGEIFREKIDEQN